MSETSKLTEISDTTQTTTLKKITEEELKLHNQEGDVWLVVNGNVYDMSVFYRKHPGGPDVIMEVAGKDATERFEAAEHTKANKIEMQSYLVG